MERVSHQLASLIDSGEIAEFNPLSEIPDAELIPVQSSSIDLADTSVHAPASLLAPINDIESDVAQFQIARANTTGVGFFGAVLGGSSGGGGGASGGSSGRSAGGSGAGGFADVSGGGGGGGAPASTTMSIAESQVSGSTEVAGNEVETVRHSPGGGDNSPSRDDKSDEQYDPNNGNHRERDGGGKADVPGRSTGAGPSGTEVPGARGEGPNGSVAVPEPSALLLTTLGLAGLVSSRRLRRER